MGAQKSAFNCRLLIIHKLKNKYLKHESLVYCLWLFSLKQYYSTPLHRSVLAQCCLLSINKPSVVNTKRCITVVKQTNKCTLTLAQRDSRCILSPQPLSNGKHQHPKYWVSAHSLTTVMLLNNEFRLCLLSVWSCVNMERHTETEQPLFTASLICVVTLQLYVFIQRSEIWPKG